MRLHWSVPARRARAWGGGLLALAGLLALTMSVTAAHAASVTVTTTAQGVNSDPECSLQEAIHAANLDASKAPDPAHLDDPDAFIETACAAGSGADVIVLPAKATFTMSGPTDDVVNYTGPTATPMVFSVITIEANGSRIQHGGGTRAYRAFAVGWGGSLTLHEIHVRGFEVHGGDGRTGGAGGLGAGGAVYVQNGYLGVGWSTFEQNGALGGDGSTGSIKVGGGGGGLGGNGGRGFPGSGFPGGGGGGGARGTGGDGDSDSFSGGSGGGGGGTVRDGESGDDDHETGTGELARRPGLRRRGRLHRYRLRQRRRRRRATFAPAVAAAAASRFAPVFPRSGTATAATAATAAAAAAAATAPATAATAGSAAAAAAVPPAAASSTASGRTAVTAGSAPAAAPVPAASSPAGPRRGRHIRWRRRRGARWRRSRARRRDLRPRGNDRGPQQHLRRQLRPAGPLRRRRLARRPRIRRRDLPGRRLAVREQLDLQ